MNGGQIVAESNNSRTIVYIYNALGTKIATYGMTIDEKLAYIIRRIRCDNKTIRANWNEADMLREMEYHEAVYRIAVFCGSDPDKKNSLSYRLKHVDFEEEQILKTYFYKYIENLLPWEIN